MCGALLSLYVWVLTCSLCSPSFCASAFDKKRFSVHPGGAQISLSWFFSRARRWKQACYSLPGENVTPTDVFPPQGSVTPACYPPFPGGAFSFVAKSSFYFFAVVLFGGLRWSCLSASFGQVFVPLEYWFSFDPSRQVSNLIAQETKCPANDDNR